MATFAYKGFKIHYEVNGEGTPILLLNGIMMSTKSWEPFLPSFTKNNQLIRLDFIDQGLSTKANVAYTQMTQVDIVFALLETLEIEKVNVVGISYGGEVALLFASRYPECVERLVLFNTTSYTSPWLKEIGYQWNRIGQTRDGQAYYQATIPSIYSPSFYENRLAWMKQRELLLVPIFSNPIFLDAMERLTNSAEDFDVRDTVKAIQAPTLIVAADEDYLTPLNNQKLLHELLPQSELVLLPGVGHASMYEKPMLFMTLVLGFINTLQTTYSI